MVEVLLVKDNNRVKGLQSVFTHYSTLFQSLRDKKVVIKPNFNTADPPPASTDIRVIKTLITYLKESKAKRITVAERAGPADTEETMKVKGLFDLHDELGGFDILDLSFLPDSKWVKYQANGLHWKNGFLYPKIYQEADVIIALPCLKTHRYGGHFTLSLKLAVGLVPRAGYNYMKELHSSPYQRTLITEINLVYSPTLIILDGVDAFTDGGPEKGTRSCRSTNLPAGFENSLLHETSWLSATVKCITGGSQDGEFHAHCGCHAPSVAGLVYHLYN